MRNWKTLEDKNLVLSHATCKWLNWTRRKGTNIYIMLMVEMGSFPRIVRKAFARTHAWEAEMVRFIVEVTSKDCPQVLGVSSPVPL